MSSSSSSNTESLVHELGAILEAILGPSDAVRKQAEQRLDELVASGGGEALHGLALVGQGAAAYRSEVRTLALVLLRRLAFKATTVVVPGGSNAAESSSTTPFDRAPAQVIERIESCLLGLLEDETDPKIRKAGGEVVGRWAEESVKRGREYNKEETEGSCSVGFLDLVLIVVTLSFIFFRCLALPSYCPFFLFDAKLSHRTALSSIQSYVARYRHPDSPTARTAAALGWAPPGAPSPRIDLYLHLLWRSRPVCTPLTTRNSPCLAAIRRRFRTLPIVCLLTWLTFALRPRFGFDCAPLADRLRLHPRLKRSSKQAHSHDSHHSCFNSPTRPRLCIA